MLWITPHFPLVLFNGLHSTVLFCHRCIFPLTFSAVEIWPLYDLDHNFCSKSSILCFHIRRCPSHDRPNMETDWIITWSSRKKRESPILWTLLHSRFSLDTINISFLRFSSQSSLGATFVPNTSIFFSPALSAIHAYHLYKAKLHMCLYTVTFPRVGLFFLSAGACS